MALISINTQRLVISGFHRAGDQFKSDCEISDESLDNAISDLRHRFDNGMHFENGYYTRVRSLAYALYFGPHGAIFACSKIREACDNCDELKDFFTQMSFVTHAPMKVVSLGGGPGNDAIGFCLAINSRGFMGRNLKIDVVDDSTGWQPFFEKLVIDNFGSLNFGAELNFLVHTLPSPDFSWKIKEYDVIIICKLFSILKRKTVREKLVEDLYLHMKDNALILWIDSPFDENLWGKWFKNLYVSAPKSTTYPSMRALKNPETYTSPSVNIHKCNISSKARIAVLRKLTDMEMRQKNMEMMQKNMEMIQKNMQILLIQ